MGQAIRSMVLTLDGERAHSLNKTARDHWSRRRRRYAESKMAVRCAFPPPVNEARGFPLQVPAEIAVRAYSAAPGPLMDHDNIDVKPYIDALKGWVIVDDNTQLVTRIDKESRRGKTDRVEIEIRWRDDE